MKLRSWLAALVAGALALTGLAVAPTASAGSPDDQLAVSVVGDGTATGNVAVGVQIHYFDGTGALTKAPTVLPTTAEGSNLPFTLGADRDQQGALQQSADRRFVTIGGYAHEPADLSLNGSLAPDILRSIAIIDEAGDYDTSTTLGGAFSERHIRGVVTADGSYFWAGGHGNDATTDVGAVMGIEAGGTEPVAIRSGSNNTNNNARVPGIHDGQLYVTTDRDDYAGLNKVGEGLPTTAVEMDLIATTDSGADVAHDFAFVGDYLYVNYTDGVMGIVKYAQQGDAWAPVDQFAGEFWGLTGRVAGDEVLLYATKGSTQGNELVSIVDSDDASTFDGTETVLAVAEAGYSFRGVDFAPGFTPGDQSLDPADRTPVITWDVRVQRGAGPVLSGVLGETTQPVATGTVTDPAGDAVVLTASSKDQSVAADDDITVHQAADGTFSVAVVPAGVGATVINLTGTAEDGRETVSRLTYWVSGALPDETAQAHTGMSDASSAADAGDGYFFAVDDDSNNIRLFAPESGEPVKEFGFDDEIGMHQAGQTFDSEGMTRQGDTIWVTGSIGNTRSGNIRPDRDIIYAVNVTGTGADAELTFAGSTRGIRAALVEWDSTDGHGLGADFFNFERATQDGYSAEGPDSLNVEGLAMDPEGNLWLGFRSPVINGSAVMIPITNISQMPADDFVPSFGDPVLLDLDGRAIRDLITAGDGNLLIMAGSADDAGNFALFGWDWDLDHAPVMSNTDLGLEGYPGSYEGGYLVTSLADGTAIRVLLDTGTVDLYGDGTEAQDLPAAELRKFFTQEVVLDFGGVFDDSDDGGKDRDDKDRDKDGNGKGGNGKDRGRDRVPVRPGLPKSGN